MFDHSCQSNSCRKNDYLRPISVRSSLLKLQEASLAFLKEKGFSSIEYNGDYSEVFATRDGFELTVTFLKSDEASLEVHLLVHTKRFFGGAKKLLSSLTRDLLLYLQQVS